MMKELRPLLDAFSQDLTTLALDGKLDPIIGRNHEIERLIELLCQNTAVLLVGKPGVGITTIVEGLTQRIASGNVPDQLHTKRVRQTDIGSLVYGLRKSGLENRLAEFVEGIGLTETILYVDDMEAIENHDFGDFGAKFEALLKQAIEQCKFLCVGSMSPLDYQVWQERNPDF